jgi:hypothetical protein
MEKNDASPITGGGENFPNFFKKMKKQKQMLFKLFLLFPQ